VNIVRPTLLLDEAKCKANIHSIAEKARNERVFLRPHFKTHQSAEIGRWFRDEGVNACTVSSIRMAAYFAANGWKDITVAFPLNYLESDEINRLALGSRLSLLAVSGEAVEKLGGRLSHPVNIFIEIDPGYHRTGVATADKSGIDKILASISSQPLMAFAGFLSHAGQSYACRSRAEIQKVHDETAALMRSLGDHYRARFPKLQLSIGDTPTCSVAMGFEGIDEIRPGNLVFYDIMQCAIGACTRDQVAIAMACPVVDIHRERNEVNIHGGSVHFSKDSFRREDGTVVYGDVVRLSDTGWMLPPLNGYVKSLSQEHGVLYLPEEEISKIQVGDVLGVLPVHSCLTADAMGEYVTMGGKVIPMMKKTNTFPAD
jgi:D-serine deaminase-like pyridoxal phosphate-dependent protein